MGVPQHDLRGRRLNRLPEIRSGGKRLFVAGQDDGPHVPVAGECAERVRERQPRRHIEGIAHLGAVDADQADPATTVLGHNSLPVPLRFVVHVGSLPIVRKDADDAIPEVTAQGAEFGRAASG